ncbi:MULTISPECIES: sigma-70 family RNA polymerase sigma factor [Marinobacter]|jgi:RNA polymerase sigma-70 factor (ECF subfamily)|uniref:sigma-70 family RNA polymerase sigma factor n=1 Tax=Marinobacter TaxID=2742 RepID=UPI000F856C0F|nr:MULTISPECIES: sigma-70 family RNA polymerase sigma factor [Marinobacter]AZR40153.1 hypothetical protein MTMN5_00683 [Marinobacter salarius]MBJ7300486.1 sigma-70 family RNA polymerase sigma factor [Marinobacter salarius]MCC4284526.1 sigma-70 family RNA polymerase sigma factor [Marinobacter salarius]MCZ4286351.1 sigma-70 family RNA polymerase sigma factor [Marinobacter salarius]MDC8455192.1 sigma-70 family RNA polymerase sigma factor [Marinobacter sp. DS40M6]|tara:strand:+ start:2728 stop:3321 length:594 start_codon:yes stop_codon:yes gene_type:complete
MSSFRHELDQQARNLSDLRSVDVTGAPNWERRLVAAYQQHRKPLVDTAQYLLGCRAKAEDVVQDAFLKVWDQGFADNVRDEGRFLHRVVRNLAIDRLRRLALENRFAACDVDVEEEAGVLSASPERQLAGTRALHHALSSLAELPARVQKVLMLTRVEGLTQREVALAIGVSPTLINFMLKDALAHCRGSLDQSYPF